MQSILKADRNMMLIADSGSTKTHWKLIGENRLESIFTDGISPFYQGIESVQDCLRNELLPKLNAAAINQIYYYGSGASQPDRQLIIEQALQPLFPNAAITIDHDLMAAARALCGTDAGIACILGTGSNSCLYNGDAILDNVPSLGFFLGDEGSGGSIGRNLLKAYFYRTIPADVKLLLEAAYNMDKATVLNDIYGATKPNQATAKYARFVIDNQDKPFCRQLLKDAFTEFVDAQVSKYADYEKLPIHFVGSLAYFCKPILADILNEKSLHMGQVIQDPMEGLVTYHLKQNNG